MCYLDMFEVCNPDVGHVRGIKADQFPAIHQVGRNAGLK